MISRPDASTVRSNLELLVPLLLAALVYVCVLGGGLPELRHDWRIPDGRDAVAPWLEAMIDGWLPVGIGEPQPYPTFYLVGLVLWPWHWFLGTFALTAFIVAVTIFLAARAAMDLVRTLGGASSTCVAAAIFAALNPWVYSKYVAGHFVMIFAYAVLLALVAETVRERPRRGVLIVLAALCITQIEYALFALAPILVWALRRREYRVVAAVILAGAPIAFGIVASYGKIRATPFNFVWEQGQSMEPLRVALLTGTEYGYGAIFARFWPATAFIVAIALAGLPGAFAERRSRVIVVLGVVAALLATGAKGPLAHAYRWAVVHVAEIGVFRELYDLVGLVAIAFIVAFAFGLGRNRVVGVVLALAGLSFAAAWMWVPPRSFFAGTVPHATLPPDPTQRVAFSPFFQPLSADGHGSGVDPDAYVHANRALPLNEAFPKFPVDVAVARAAFAGDDRDLAALGVGEVLARPYLQTDFRALQYQWPYRDAFVVAPQHTRTLAAAPMLSLSVSAPQLATIASRPDENAVFFGDAEPDRIYTFDPTSATNDAGTAWVDARLAFPLHPAWGTAFGGVTTRSDARLPLPPHDRWRAILALADGTLIDDAGRVVVAGASTLHWWPLAPSARSLRCAGTCLVVLIGSPPAGAAEHERAVVARALEVHFITPWLATATVAQTDAGSLRLNVRFDEAWLALRSGRPLEHRRIASAVNGWQLDGTGRTLYFVERIAAIQCAQEILAFVALIALVLVPGPRRSNRFALEVGPQRTCLRQMTDGCHQ